VHSQISRRITGENQFFNAVAPADVNAKHDGFLKRHVADVPLTTKFIVCDLDGDRAVIILGA
jgi:hypothetical protein